MNALVIAELKLRQAQLSERAERLRQQWRRVPTGINPAKAVALGKEVKALDERAADYAALLRVAEEMKP